jgi:hypothetical protein
MSGARTENTRVYNTTTSLLEITDDRCAGRKISESSNKPVLSYYSTLLKNIGP